ncbi:MAG TPA: MBL fold metallo-hydrolase [Pyrinomonadaceae bacterium]|nr:MBL fold metallo-hydrolase [Pyrinomonadaceae bacterium]
MKIGDYRLEIIPDTEFRLDGGAMFGVVPRVLWERVSPPDELNRIRMNMNCVFVDTGAEKILIETGIGEKWSEKEQSMYGIFREKPLAESLFDITGCTPDDITIVVNTHLHFDHAGGNTIHDTLDSLSPRSSTAVPVADRRLNETSPRCIPQFPNARYFVSKSELEHARNPHERDRASYLPQNWEPLIASGQLDPRPDDYEVVEGLRMQTIRGHSQTMQTWRLDRGGRTVYGFADLIPTEHHLLLPWIMGYDLYPAETLEFKKRVLPEAIRENWLCLFYHNVGSPLRAITQVDGKITSVERAG